MYILAVFTYDWTFDLLLNVCIGPTHVGYIGLHGYRD